MNCHLEMIIGMSCIYKLLIEEIQSDHTNILN